MSTTIDQKVVEMRFDNRHFENNVSTTMSTLDKLKRALRLDGATRGMEEVAKASKRMDFSQAEIAATKAGFRIQDIWIKVASTFEYQVANRIVNAATNMWNQLTVAPVGDGFKEYEMTLNAVQTTMAGTGKTAEEVEKELKKLDEYADKTVYSTSDMLNNLPKFTNAGVELEDATKAMIGIANATALAGGDAGKASIAFYNLGQAIGTGYLTRMDYNSINNAGIATMEWKEQMVEAAIAAGTLSKAGDDLYEAGGKTFTMQQLFIDGLQHQWATTEVMMKVFGDYGDETTEVGKKAYSAAQDIKTFTMMMDSLKATAGTGWKDTWQIIFGGLDEAKEFWTGLTNILSGAITAWDDWRNELLGKALGNPFEGLVDALNSVGNPIETVTENLEELEAMATRVIRGEFGNGEERVQKLTEAGWNYAKIQNIVNERLGSSVRLYEDVLGEQKDTKKANYETIESLLKLSDAELEAAGCTKEEIKALRTLSEYAEKTGIPIEELTKDLDQLSGRNLLINSFKNIGKVLGDLGKVAGDAWQSIFPPKGIDKRAKGIYDVLAGIHKFTRSIKFSIMDEETGKLTETGDKLARTFKGVFAAVDLVLTVVGGPLKWAFMLLKEILAMFDLDILDLTAAIGDVIVGFRDWLKENNLITKALEALSPHIKNVVKWLIDWVNKIDLADWFNKVVDKLVEAKNAVVKWINGFKEAEDVPKYISEGIGRALKWIIDLCLSAGKSIRDGLLGALRSIPGASKWVDKLAEAFDKVDDFVRNALDAIGEWIKGLNETENAPKYIITTFVNGLKNGVPMIVKAVKQLGDKLMAQLNKIPGFERWFKKWFGGIREIFADIGKWFGGFKDIFVNLNTEDAGTYIIEGLVNGLKNGVKKVFDTIANIGNMLIETICEVLGIHSPSVVFFAIGGFIIAGLIGGLVDGFPAVYDKVKALFSTVLNIALSLGESIIGIIKQLDLGKVVSIAIAGGALVILFLLAKTLHNLSKPIGTFGDLMDNLKDSFKGVGKSIKNFFNAGALISFALAILILAGALAVIANIPEDRLLGAVFSLAALAAVIIGIGFAVGAIGKIGKLDGKSVLILIGIASALIAVAFVLAKLTGFNIEESWPALAALVGAVLLMGLVATGLSRLIKKDTGIDKVGGFMIKLSIAMLAMIGVMKLAGMITPQETKNAALVIGAITIVFGILGAIARCNKGGTKYIQRFGTMLVRISFAMLLMLGVIKLAGMMVNADKNGDMWRGALVVAGIGILFGAFIKVANQGKGAGQAALLILSAAASILMVLKAIKMISEMNGWDILDGLLVISAMGLLLAGFTHIVKDNGANAAKIGIMLLAVSGAILILTGVIWLIGQMDPGDVKQGTIVVGVLVGLIAGLIAVTKLAENVKMGTMIALIAGIAILVGAVVGLSFIDHKSLMSATVAISMLMLVFGFVLGMSKLADGSIGVLITLTVAIAALAGVLWLVSTLPVESTLKNTGALAGLLILLMVAIAVLHKYNGQIQDTITAIGALILISTALLILVHALKKLSGVDNAVWSAIALTGLMAAMVGLLFLINKGAVQSDVYKALGVVASIAVLSLSLIPLIIALALMSGVQNATSSAKALAVMMIALTAVLVLLDAVPVDVKKSLKIAASMALIAASLFVVVLALLAMSGIENTVTNAVILAGMLVAMAIVIKTLSKMKTNTTKATIALVSIAALVVVMQGIVAALKRMSGVEKAWNSVLLFATMLAVMTGVVWALSAMSSIIGGALIGVVAMIALAGAMVVLANGMSALGGLSLSEIGISLLALAGAFVVLGLAALILTPVIPAILGLAGAIALIGVSVLAAGLGLNLLANGFSILATVLSTQAVTMVNGLNILINGLIMLIPTIIQSIGQGITTFCNTIVQTAPAVGQALLTILNTIATTVMNFAPTFFEMLGVIVTQLTQFLIETIPQWIEVFTTLVSSVITAITELAPQFGTLAVTLITTLCTTLIECIPQIVEVGVTLIMSLLEGIQTIVPQIIETGWTIIMSFLTSIRDNIGEVATTALEIITNFINGIAEGLPGVIDSAFNLIISFINGLADAITNNNADLVAAVDNLITAVINAIVEWFTSIKDKGSELAGKVGEGIGSMVEDVRAKAGEIGDAIKGKLEEFKEKLKTVGGNIMDGLKSGIESAKEKIVSAAETAGSWIKDKFNKLFDINSPSKVMEETGGFIMDGLRNGLLNAKERILGAVQTASSWIGDKFNKIFNINSPSKVMEETGGFIMAGLSNGITEGGDAAAQSAEIIAKSILKALTDLLSGVGETDDLGIDINPTITPVLDLSNVKTGISAIDSMLSGTPTLGIAANVATVNGVNAMMSNRQNGATNDDVVTAIDKLNKKLDSVGGTTYNLNGMSYTGDADLDSAFQTIIQAARLERRS